VEAFAEHAAGILPVEVTMDDETALCHSDPGHKADGGASCGSTTSQRI